MTLTKSWLQKAISDIETMRDEIPFGLDEDGNNTLAALKLALAGMEAEPVAWRRFQKTPKDGGYWVHYDERNTASELQPLYSAPQPLTTSERAELENYRNAQQVVPLSASADLDEGFERWYSEDARVTDSVAPEWFSEALKPVFLGTWRACRAAMLQGAEIAESPTTMQTAPALDSSPKIAEPPSGNSPVIPDGWAMVPIEPTAEMISSGVAAHYDRNKIQIHDRPAPGPIECAYVAMIAAAPQQEVK